MTSGQVPKISWRTFIVQVQRMISVRVLRSAIALIKVRAVSAKAVLAMTATRVMGLAPMPSPSRRSQHQWIPKGVNGQQQLLLQQGQAALATLGFDHQRLNP